jgi:hypothetical protein
MEAKELEHGLRQLDDLARDETIRLWQRGLLGVPGVGVHALESRRNSKPGLAGVKSFHAEFPNADADE